MSSSANVRRINRYIMECKYVWKQKAYKHPEGELIDTLWNVNKSSKKQRCALEQGINRYIMECKLLDGYAVMPKDDRINRYIMECK